LGSIQQLNAGGRQPRAASARTAYDFFNQSYTRQIAQRVNRLPSGFVTDTGLSGSLRDRTGLGQAAQYE
jgi:hypothetical protein